MYIVEFKTERRFNFKRFRRFHISNQNDTYFTKVKTIKEAKKLILRGKLHLYKTNYYDERWKRNGSYRKKYFETHKPDSKGLYQCVYCGRKVPKNGVTIDHVISVDTLKNSKLWRFIATLKGYSGTNDPRNLVAACNRCNQIKGTSLNIKWFALSKIGKNKYFWIIVNIARFIIVVTLILLIIHILLNIEITTF